MLKTHSFSLAFLLSLASFGCVQSSSSSGNSANTDPTCGDVPTPGCVISANVARVMKPAIPASDREALTAGNTDFSLDLYGRFRATPGNLFYSPYSISSALAMTYAGAHGDTETQMAKALHFTLPQAKLHPAFNGLDQELASRGDGASGGNDKVQLSIANALWGQAGFSFQAPFLTVLAESYGTGMRPLDFQKSPEPSRITINDWVADKTEDRIKDLLPKGLITPATKFVLTNAIYFNAAWKTPFEAKNTAPGAFTKQDGTKVMTPMMGAQGAELNYGEGDGYAALEIPYAGSKLSMVLALPTDLDAFEKSLDAAKLDAIIASLSDHSVELKLPKFSFSAEQDLTETLSDMGMTAAFSGEADFSGIDGKRDLSISAVLHKAFILVSEAGTEAAAATAVVVGNDSVPVPAKITFDHPFLFFIRDNATRTLLFVGRVSDPTK